jgi:hypothetical protein
MTKEQQKYVYDGPREAHYVRAWREGRGRNADIVVQVWKNKTTPEGEPCGDWVMPGILGVAAAINQATLQTK